MDFPFDCLLHFNREGREGYVTLPLRGNVPVSGVSSERSLSITYSRQNGGSMVDKCLVSFAGLSSTCDWPTALNSSPHFVQRILEVNDLKDWITFLQFPRQAHVKLSKRVYLVFVQQVISCPGIMINMQTFQLSRFDRETRGLGCHLKVSRFCPQISRWTRKPWNLCS